MRDLNARCRASGYTNSFNGTGRGLENLIKRGVCQRIRPDFPTFLTAVGSTKPDVALSNARLSSNTHIYPGPLTPCDNLPFMVKLSTRPIQVPIRPGKYLAKANWVGYREDLERAHTTDLTDATLENIDSELRNFINLLNQSDKNISQ